MSLSQLLTAWCYMVQHFADYTFLLQIVLYVLPSLIILILTLRIKHSSPYSVRNIYSFVSEILY